MGARSRPRDFRSDQACDARCETDRRGSGRTHALRVDASAKPPACPAWPSCNSPSAAAPTIFTFRTISARTASMYPGTHDNDTTLGWYAKVDENTRDHVRRYLRVSGARSAGISFAVAYDPSATLAVIPLQDLLNLGSEARFNTPGTSRATGPGAIARLNCMRCARGASGYMRELGESLRSRGTAETGCCDDLRTIRPIVAVGKPDALSIRPSRPTLIALPLWCQTAIRLLQKSTARGTTSSRASAST